MRDAPLRDNAHKVAAAAVATCVDRELINVASFLGAPVRASTASARVGTAAARYAIPCAAISADTTSPAASACKWGVDRIVEVERRAQDSNGSTKY